MDKSASNRLVQVETSDGVPESEAVNQTATFFRGNSAFIHIQTPAFHSFDCSFLGLVVTRINLSSVEILAFNGL